MLLVFFAWLGFICISIFMLFHENSALPSNLRVISVIFLFLLLLMWTVRKKKTLKPKNNDSFDLMLFFVWFDYLLFGGLFLYLGTFGNFVDRVFLLIVLFFVLVVWSIRNSRKKARQAAALSQSQQTAPVSAPSPAPISAPAAASSSVADDSDVISFHVAGTTFSNDDGTSRQAILRHMKFGDSPYADGQDPTDLSISIEESDFDGELALEVYANGYQIGFVPKKLISKVKRAMDQGAMVTAAQIIGGGKDDQGNIISWGCIVELEY